MNIESLQGDDDNTVYRAWLLIPLDDADQGMRPTVPRNDFGQECPNISFETFQVDGAPGQVVQYPVEGEEYQIVVMVKNTGNAPVFGLCIDFMQLTSLEHRPGTDVSIFTTLAFNTDCSLLSGESKYFRSTKWIPIAPQGTTNKSIIVRAYDPFMDSFTDYGNNSLHVPNDRHLAYRSY